MCVEVIIYIPSQNNQSLTKAEVAEKEKQYSHSSQLISVYLELGLPREVVTTLDEDKMQFGNIQRQQD